MTLRYLPQRGGRSGLKPKDKITLKCVTQRTVNIKIRRHGVNQFEPVQHSLTD